MKTEIVIVVAKEPGGGIGLNGGFPWPHLKGDLPRVKVITTAVPEVYPGAKNVVVFGWKTMESLRRKPEDPISPLPHRINAVVSRDPKKVPPEGFTKFGSLAQVIHEYEGVVPTIFIMGGTGLYQEALDTQVANKMIITEVFQSYPADTYFPAFNLTDWNRKVIDTTDEYEVIEYTRR